MLENWNIWPSDWMSQGNRSMTSYIEGAPDWVVECGEIRSSMEFVFPNWERLLEEGYRYYVLTWNVYDTERCSALFFANPNDAQRQFEYSRDPLGKHRNKEES